MQSAGRQPSAFPRHSRRIAATTAEVALILPLAVLCAVGSLTISPLTVLAQSARIAPAAATGRASKAKPGMGSTSATPASKTTIRAELQAAQHLLDSDQRDDVETGIQSLGLLGVEDAVEPLATRIRRGLPPELLELAITTLTALGQVKASPVLAQLTLHRRPEVRRQAVEALAAAQGPDIEPVLLRALSDSDPQVRSAAANALRDVGTSRSVDRLFVALDHGNGDAAAAIGKLVDARSVARLYPYLGKVGFRQLTPALATVLKRKDVAERDKLELIGRLQEVATHDVKMQLDELLASSRNAFSPAVQRAISRVVQDIAN